MYTFLSVSRHVASLSLYLEKTEDRLECEMESVCGSAPCGVLLLVAFAGCISRRALLYVCTLCAPFHAVLCACSLCVKTPMRLFQGLQECRAICRISMVCVQVLLVRADLDFVQEFCTQGVSRLLSIWSSLLCRLPLN